MNPKVVHTCFNSAKRHQDYVTNRLNQIDQTHTGEFIDQDEIEDLMRLSMTLSSMIDRLHHDFANAELDANIGEVEKS
jgi:hypothetical protein